MITVIPYELWDGKKCVGYYYSLYKLEGSFLEIYEASLLKSLYGKTDKTIKVPIVTRKVQEYNSDTLLRTVLDVSKKSKRQIKLLSKRLIP